MNDEHCVSRRASLKGLGAMGAAMVLGGAAPTAQQAAAKPVPGAQDKQAPNLADVAVTRFNKGHS